MGQVRPSLKLGRSLSLLLRRDLGLVALAAFLLALSFGAWIVFSPAAQAAGAPLIVTCASGESGLQTAFDSAQPGTPLTISIDRSNCRMTISNGLTIGAGVDITINGRGLSLDSQNNQNLSIISISDTQAAPSSLALNDVTLQNAAEGVVADNGSFATDSSVSLHRSTVQGMTSDALFVTNCTLDHSTIAHNGYSGVGCVTADVSDSTISDNDYGIASYMVTLTNSIVSDNTYGFYVYQATVRNSTFSDNTYGVLIDNDDFGDSSITNSTLSGNGYAVYLYDTNEPPMTMTVSHSRLSGNTYGMGAGLSDDPLNYGIGADDPDAPEYGPHGILTLNQSEISGSTEAGINSIGLVTVTASTISDSKTIGLATINTATVTDSTITGNATGIDAANVLLASSTIASNSDDGIAGDSAAVSASILADNGQSCDVPLASLTDDGYNLTTDTSCGFTPGSTSQTVTAAQLKLQPLVDNGGARAGVSGSRQTVSTIALGYGSVAINLIGLDQSGQCLVGTQVDQRGVARPQGSACDAGAFEANLLATTDPGSSTVVRRGYYAVIRVEVLDADGRNISSRNVPVTSVELDGPNGQVIAFDHPFQLGRFSGQPGYQLSINTRNLARGSWTLVVTIGDDAYPATLDVGFSVQ